jgi:hypothetical protein
MSESQAEHVEQSQLPATEPVAARASGAAEADAIRLLGAAIGNRALARLVAEGRVARGTLLRKPAPPLPPPTAGGVSAATFEGAIGTDAAKHGQMLFNNAIHDQLVAALRAAPGPPAIKDHFREALNEMWTHDWKNYELTRAHLVRLLRREPAGSALKGLLGSESARSSQAGGALVGRFWKGYSKSGSVLPSMGRHVTLYDFEGVWKWEKSACWTAAQRLGFKFFTFRPGGKPKSGATVNVALMASIKKSNRKTDAAALGRVRGDEVIGRKDLVAQVDRIKRALADGQIVHARVVSGIHLDMAGAGTPNEEHSLVVFGYDRDKFLYFDPDVAGSGKPVRPFGTLFLDRVNNRLSTAETDADFLSDGGGFDRKGVHRYQVVRAYSI